MSVVRFSFPEKGSRVLREWNEKRAIERAIVARQAAPLQRRSFSAASIDRLTASMQNWSNAINADLDNGLVIMRARARSLCANNEYGRRFLSLVATNTIGASGPTLQVRALLKNGRLDKKANDAIEIHWAQWAKSADITGRMSLARLLQVCLKGVARDGEGLIRYVRDKNLPYGLGLQLLEPDRLSEALNTRLSAGGQIRQGVELDTRGRPVAYHLSTAHPGENFLASAGQVERVLARDLLHCFIPERAEQVRGYTWLHAVLLRAQMLHGYEEAAVVAARVGASKMGIWTRGEDGEDLAAVATGKDASGNLQMSAEPGDFIEAPLGYKLESWNPDYPHQNFESFLKACLRGLSSGVDVATHNLSGDMTEVNYSSARIAELGEREIWKLLQEWVNASVLLPIFREWLSNALMRGDITLDSGSPLPADRLGRYAEAVRFQGRRWDWVDPLKDAQAARELLGMALTSRTRIAAAQGCEFEDIVDELAQEQQMLQERGLPMSSGAGPTAPPASMNDEPKTEGEPA